MDSEQQDPVIGSITNIAYNIYKNLHTEHIIESARNNSYSQVKNFESQQGRLFYRSAGIYKTKHSVILVREEGTNKAARGRVSGVNG